MVEQDDDDDEEPEGQSMQSIETDQPSAIADTITDVVVRNLFDWLQSEFSTEWFCSIKHFNIAEVPVVLKFLKF